MQPATDSWLRNFSAARAAYVETASSNSFRFSIGLPKVLELMMPFLGLGLVSRGIQEMPRSCNTVRSPTTVRCLRIQYGLAYLRCLAEIIPFSCKKRAYQGPMPQTSSILTLDRNMSISNSERDVKTN